MALTRTTSPQISTDSYVQEGEKNGLDGRQASLGSDFVQGLISLEVEPDGRSVVKQQASDQHH